MPSASNGPKLRYVPMGRRKSSDSPGMGSSQGAPVAPKPPGIRFMIRFRV